MFGGMQRVRLKSAEQAVRDGRIDEAYRLAGQSELATTPRGQKILGTLGRCFVDRARGHYRAERFTEALLDIGRAQHCGGVQREADELREQVVAVADDVARQSTERQNQINQARMRIQRGSIAAGRQILEQLDADDPAAKKLSDKLDVQHQAAQSLIEQAESFIKQGRLDRAAARLVEATKLDAHNATLVELEQKLCDQVTRDAWAAFDGGSLDRVRRLIDSLQTLGVHHAGRAEVVEMLRLADEAAIKLADGQFEEALTRTNRLMRIAPKIGWVKQAAQELARLDAALLSLRSGPLGEAPVGGKIAGANRVNGGDATVTAAMRRPVNPPANSPGIATSLPSRLLMLIDGGGSFLLLTDHRVSVGRAASGKPADIAIYSDLSERHADIMRVDEDYFLLSPHDVEVAGRRTRHQLLRDGDRVVLSRRAKFTFHLPDRKSASARIDLSDSTRLPHDVRRVVLFRRTATMGGGAGHHIECRAPSGGLVLFERAGGLYVRGRGGANADARSVELGESVEIDGVNFVVKEWTTPTSGVEGFI